MSASSKTPSWKFKMTFYRIFSRGSFTLENMGTRKKKIYFYFLLSFQTHKTGIREKRFVIRTWAKISCWVNIDNKNVTRSKSYMYIYIFFFLPQPHETRPLFFAFISLFSSYKICSTALLILYCTFYLPRKPISKGQY